MDIRWVGHLAGDVASASAHFGKLEMASVMTFLWPQHTSREMDVKMHTMCPKMHVENGCCFLGFPTSVGHVEYFFDAQTCHELCLGLCV